MCCVFRCLLQKYSNESLEIVRQQFRDAQSTRKLSVGLFEVKKPNMHTWLHNCCTIL